MSAHASSGSTSERTSAAERAYRLLLRAYPAEFRAAYGREMALAFRDLRRAASDGSDAGGIRFWAWALWDVARSAPALRLEAWRARWSTDIQLEGSTMKTMAILSVLVGAVVAASSFAEGWLGGVMYHNAISLTGGIMGSIAGTMLLFAGVSMLRRAPRAAVLARRAALACLTMILFVPRMGVFAILLSVGFPIVLLVYLHRTRGRSTPMAA